MKAILVYPAMALVAALAIPAMALDPLQVTPARTEVIARVNIRAIADTSLLQSILQQRGVDGQRLEAGISLIQGLTGVDVRKDLEDIWLMGLANDEKKHVVLARGKFDREKLLNLLRINPTFHEHEMEGHKVYEWTDDEGQKFGLFPDDTTVAITGKEEVLTALLKEMKRVPGQGFLETPAAKQMDSDYQEAAFYGMLIKRPETGSDFGEFASAVDLSHSTLRIDVVEDSRLKATMTAVPNSAEAAPHYLKVAEGLLAAAALFADEKPGVRLLSQELTARLADDGASLVVEGEISNEQVLAVIAENAK